MIFNESIYNKDWPIKKLSQLGDFSRGVSKHRPRDDARLFIDGDIPFLQTGEVKSARLYVDSYSAKYNDFGLSQSKLWHKGTLCITIAANIAESAILSRDMCFPDSIVGFVPNDNETTSEYMYYIFEYIKSQIQSRTNGSIQDNINIDYLKDLEFRISPNQEKIKKVLSDIDNKILLNQAIIGKLESMAKTLYDYWFVQFDFPDANGRPYKTSGGKMEWNETLSREIPAGWEVRKVKDIEAKIVTGKTPSTAQDDFYNGNIPFVTIGDIRNHVFVTNTDIRLTKAGAESQSNKYLPPNSLCVSCIASPGEIGFTTEWSQTNQQINSIVIEDEDNRIILYFALKDYFLYNAAVKTGNTFANMSKTDFSEIALVYPTKHVLRVFAKKTQPIFRKLKKAELENRKLITFRDFLLPMLMNGQVTFRQ